MRRALFTSLVIAGLGLVLSGGCGGGKKADDEPAAKTEDKAEAKTDQGSAADEKADEKSAEVKPAEPLTEEELRLIEADPKDLSPDERRARSYALRKKIMQNPDSAAAKAIQEGKEAIERGEVDIPPHLLKEGADPQGGGSSPMLSAPAPKNEPTGLQR